MMPACARTAPPPPSLGAPWRHAPPSGARSPMRGMGAESDWTRVHTWRAWGHGDMAAWGRGGNLELGAWFASCCALPYFGVHQACVPPVPCPTLESISCSARSAARGPVASGPSRNRNTKWLA